MKEDIKRSCCCATACSGLDTADAEARRRRQLLIIGVGLPVWVLLYWQLRNLANLFTFKVLGLEAETRLGEAVAFFIFDAPKVLMLLTLIVFVIGIINTFFTPERTRAILAGKRESVGNVLAAMLGIVTPFCSCSAVPLFIGFVQVGVPLGVTLSFLIAAPMVNEVALVLLFGLVGWKVALAYLLTGLTIAIIAGWIIGRLHLEKWVEEWVYEIQGAGDGVEERLTWSGRIDHGLNSVRDIVGKVWPYILIGVGVGAGIHGYVPEGALVSIMGRGAWWSVPLAVLLGIPMYSNAAGIIPVVETLLAKGAALGTVLAFMMATIGLSLPEGIILRKVLKPQLIAVFFGVVGSGILLVGFLFNAIWQ
ncbi:MAG: permease [Armatimonadota bacterium]